jgi:hypothetical protein
MKKHYRNQERLSEKLSTLLQDIYREFGWLPRIAAPLIGRYLHFTMNREARRLANGWTYEPKSFCEKNPAAIALETATCKTAKNLASKGYLPAPAFACTRLQANP